MSTKLVTAEQQLSGFSANLDRGVDGGRKEGCGEKRKRKKEREEQRSTIHALKDHLEIGATSEAFACLFCLFCLFFCGMMSLPLFLG